MKISEETVKIELHTIATYDGKEYELEELMNNMFKINAELHSIIKEVREYCKNDDNFELIDLYSQPIADRIQEELLEILDKVGDIK